MASPTRDAELDQLLEFARAFSTRFGVPVHLYAMNMDESFGFHGIKPRPNFSDQASEDGNGIGFYKSKETVEGEVKNDMLVDDMVQDEEMDSGRLRHVTNLDYWLSRAEINGRDCTKLLLYVDSLSILQHRIVERIHKLVTRISSRIHEISEGEGPKIEFVTVNQKLMYTADGGEAKSVKSAYYLPVEAIPPEELLQHFNLLQDLYQLLSQRIKGANAVITEKVESRSADLLRLSNE